uniref:CCHC-type domain-containing protein n=1 Tax=Tanacetum cinerariifolium TaxID=118510 RepID=A0A6L2LBD2_TANCI|nr:hypothetical protein [Tanacetum cinerariifolium]
MIPSGANNRPPMLDKDLYESWKSKMELYMQNKENGRMILESVKHGTRANTSRTKGNYSCQQRVVKCFNCQWEGHMARQCPKPKRKRDATWFKEKVLLVEAQGNGKVLNEEGLEFFADPDCDEISTAKAVLMANLSSYESDVLFEVLISDNTNNDMLNQSVQEMSYFEPSNFMDHSKNEIHSDSNIIPYS